MQKLSRSTAPLSPRPADTVLQSTAIAGLGAVAVIHFSQVVPTTEETPWLGAAFVVLSLACLGVAAQLLYRCDRVVWVQVGILNTLAIAGYAFTRLITTPFDNTDVGNWSEMLGVAALFVEGILVILSIHAITGRPRFLSPPAPFGTTRDAPETADSREWSMSKLD
jgi:hypothetical protein